MIDCFKGILMTHDLDIFESGKNLGLNGLSKKKNVCERLIFEPSKKKYKITGENSESPVKRASLFMLGSLTVSLFGYIAFKKKNPNV